MLRKYILDVAFSNKQTVKKNRLQKKTHSKHLLHLFNDLLIRIPKHIDFRMFY